MTATAFREAFLARMKRDAVAFVMDMDSLLKIAAAGRLLARLMEADERWVLKGGLNMLAHLGLMARLTRDADLAAGLDRDVAVDAITAAAEKDLADHFHFRVRPPGPLPADGERGGLRFRVDAVVGGRPLASFDLDIVLAAPDPADVEWIALPNLLAFAGIDAPKVRALRPGRQTVEKLHAYTRDYGRAENSRPRDLVDMLALAAAFTFSSDELAYVGRAVFTERGRQSWPPRLEPPPAAWNAYWERNGRGAHGLPDVDLAGASGLLAIFWSPVLAGLGGKTWDPPAWGWA